MEWEFEVVRAALVESARGRGTLVICENIMDAGRLHQLLELGPHRKQLVKQY